MRLTISAQFRGLVRVLRAWAVAAAFACPAAAGAHNVVLEWDPSPEPEVAGYRIYFGLRSGEYTEMRDNGAALRTTLGGLATGQTYYCVITAYNGAGLESAPSEEVAVSALAPNGRSVREVRIDGSTARILVDGDPGTVQRVEFSNDMQLWTELAQFVNNGLGVEVVDPDAGLAHRRFYRVTTVPQDQ